MRILLDTSILVAAVVEAHPMHDVALPWLQRARAHADTGLVAAHSLAELYAILTTLPVRPRIAPAIAWELIQKNVLNAFEIVTLSGEDYAAIINRLSEMGIVGGVTYDALILQAADKANAERIVTLNETDFRRVAPYLACADRFSVIKRVLEASLNSEPRGQVQVEAEWASDAPERTEVWIYGGTGGNDGHGHDDPTQGVRLAGGSG